MAIQPNEIKTADPPPWVDVKGTEDAKRLVDEIEPRIDHDLKRMYGMLPSGPFCIKCPEHLSPLVLEEIKRRYHGWAIRSGHHLGGHYEGTLVFYFP